MIVRQCYFSASRLDSEWDIANLVEQCNRRNRDAGISGILLHEDGTFMQILEGEPAVVEQLFAKIARDPRHRYVTELHTVESDRRLFGEWPMAYMGRKQFANSGQSPNKEQLAALQSAYQEAGNKELQKVLSSFFLDVRLVVN